MKISRFGKILTTRHFWIVAAMLAVCAFFHYLPAMDGALALTRQSVVRIIYLLPVAAASFAFGQAGGLFTLVVAVVLMIPRIVLISSQPVDAAFETAGVAVVGYLIVWMIETQEQEKRLRQRAVDELQAVNAIALTLTQPYDLDAMLSETLARVLQVVGGLRSRGVLFLLDPWGDTLHLRVSQGLSPEFRQRAQEVPLGDCLCGLAAERDQVLLVPNALNHPSHTRCLIGEPHSHACVPLKSKQRVVGVMDFFLDADVSLDGIDQEMLAAIGRQIGVAVENARLCENLRFYVRQITHAQESERKRIARELHDDTVQRMIDLSRRVDNISTMPEVPQGVAEQLEVLRARIEDTVHGVRRFSQALRPSVLDDLGLLPAIEGLLAELEQAGIETALGIVGSPRRLESEVEIDLYRIAQEALNNVRRHSGATKVIVTAQYGDRVLQITVQDNGSGFERMGHPGDFAMLGMYGLVGMEERAQRLHGQLKIMAAEGGGTVVMVQVPISSR
jgi:signal transduction histidine kinase